MHKNIILVVGITILFLGLTIQPSIATVQPKEEIIDDNPITITFKNRILFMIVFIKNTGNSDIYNVPWELRIREYHDHYFKYPTGVIKGNIEILKANETMKFRTPIIVSGLDMFWALIEYWVDGVWHYERADGWVLGPFILWVYMSP